MPDSYLLLVPRVPRTDPESYVRQEGDIEIFRQAILGAGLAPLDRPEPLVIDDAAPRPLIERVYEADFAIFDANAYGSSPAIPLLYYLIALRHSLCNRTLLLVRSADHLPAALRTHHTLTYSESGVIDFFKRFRRVVEEIRSGDDDLPDNPIQDYLKAQEIARKAQEAAREISQKQEQIDRLTQQVSAGAPPPRISFRRVEQGR